MIVIGAIIGAGGVGYLVGVYPVDSALTAGLCMANRGGNGDLGMSGYGGPYGADRLRTAVLPSGRRNRADYCLLCILLPVIAYGRIF